MGRWTQFDEDPFRLPDGFKRVAYDTDSKRYTFVDAHGTKYVGNPGEEYGSMTPVDALPVQPRPGAFSEEYINRPLPASSDTEAASSFLDILPSSRIGAAPPSFEDEQVRKAQEKKHGNTSTSHQLTQSQIADVVQTAMPKVQSMLQNIRRSVTSARRDKGGSPPAYGDRKSPAYGDSKSPAYGDSKSPACGDSKSPAYGHRKAASEDAPPAYSDDAWDAQKAQWERADEKSLFRGRSNASSVGRGSSGIDRGTSIMDHNFKQPGSNPGHPEFTSQPESTHHPESISHPESSLARAQSNTSSLNRTSSSVSSLDYASSISPSYLDRSASNASSYLDRSQSVRSDASGVSDVSRATRMSVNDALAGLPATPNAPLPATATPPLPETRSSPTSPLSH
ncbi:hypothetical protein BD626DRAFT_627373 [Schizophyllum amplum]|uniref:Uncharacterized protein n=1 Tax=Schizophyllum amplum TaxID=97359 RepID=A0A550CQ25_9AGAR|nr:hypothetical protein BD626DRAFT_627373 [Auriculariopsis ampla]